MKWKSYVLMETAIEDGLAGGWRRAHKHTDTPTPEAVQHEQLQYIMNALCEILDFDENPQDLDIS